MTMVLLSMVAVQLMVPPMVHTGPPMAPHHMDHMDLTHIPLPMQVVVMGQMDQNVKT